MTLKHPILLSILCGELYFLIFNQQRVKTIVKTTAQRTKEENSQIKRGLRRSLILEALIFVPLTIVLFYFTVFPLVLSKLIQIHPDITVWYAVMGIIAYNFPFVILKEVIIRIAKESIKIALETFREYKNAGQ